MIFKEKTKIIYIVGARPNFMKIAPLIEEAKKCKTIKSVLVHTGQHYDFEMSQVFFKELNIPKPDYNLGVGSGSHAWQTAKIMEKLEPIILKEKPDLVIVVGDVNSTLAGALTAAKLHVPIAHIEAGLRSFDISMPEEINRRLTDQISNYLFVTEPSGVKNLLNEGISKKKIYFVGNVMIDTLKKSKAKNEKSKILKRLGLERKKYAVLTLHRPSNVDKKATLLNLFSVFKEIQNQIKIIYPIHPRTKKQIKKFNLKNYLKQMNNFFLISPLSYIDMIKLVKESKFLMTDSGGLQEESTFLRIPCLTLRENTERPITIEKGTNTLCGNEKKIILQAVNKILAGKGEKGQIPKLWDGKASQRIIRILNEATKI